MNKTLVSCRTSSWHPSWAGLLVAAMVAGAGFSAPAAEPVPQTLEAEHGVVCRLSGERFGYFGWPTVARMDDGTLVVASSGFRFGHICPFGKTVLHESKDDGRTWSESRVIHDSPIDDRDAGILNLGGKSLLVSWFRSDTRFYLNLKKGWPSAAERAIWNEALADWTDAMVEPLVGSWVMRSDDGGATWSIPRWLVFTGSPPHLLRHSSGPLVMTYGYREEPYGQRVAISRDDGKTWEGDWILRGDGPDFDLGYPSTVELADGSLLTVCYQKAAKGEKCSLLWSKWKLPAASQAARAAAAKP